MYLIKRPNKMYAVDKASVEIGGKARAMVVVKSRKDCVRYFKEINKTAQGQKRRV